MRREGHGNTNARQPLPGPNISTERRGLDARARPAQAEVKTPHGDPVPPGPPGSACARGTHRGDALISGASHALGAPQPGRMLRLEPEPVPSPPRCTHCGPGEVGPSAGGAEAQPGVLEKSTKSATRGPPGTAYTRSTRAQRSAPVLVPWPMREHFRGWPAASRHLCPTAPALGPPPPSRQGDTSPGLPGEHGSENPDPLATCWHSQTAHFLSFF